jgi:pilus assembly protein Flp/PilA
VARHGGLRAVGKTANFRRLFSVWIMKLQSPKGMNMRTILAKLWKEEEGQDLTEYALLLVLIALASMAALTPLATAINSVFSNAAVNLNAGT